MMRFAEKLPEAGATIAASRAVAWAKRGNFKKALLWAIPLAASAFVLWRIRRQA